MKAGDRVSIHSGRAYTDEATIETLCHPEELPTIPGAPNIDAVRAILAEQSFVAVAMISYKFLDQTLCFVAFQNTKGEWSDLKGQQLIIEPRAAENELDRLLKKQQERRAAGIRVVRRAAGGIDWSKF